MRLVARRRRRWEIYTEVRSGPLGRKGCLTASSSLAILGEREIQTVWLCRWNFRRECHRNAPDSYHVVPRLGSFSHVNALPEVVVSSSIFTSLSNLPTLFIYPFALTVDLDTCQRRTIGSVVATSRSRP